jgi:hypothetical protein
MTYVFLGLACWLATLIITESKLTKPLRLWLGEREAMEAVRRYERGGRRPWHYVAYLVHCNLCAGTWIALLIALAAPPIVPVPVVGWLLTGLTIKSLAHAALVFQHVVVARTQLSHALTEQTDARPPYFDRQAPRD